MGNSTKLTTEEIVEVVNRVVVEEFEAEGELRPETHLREDLGMDSLDGVDLVVALEVAFGFRIAEEEARGIRTLGDVYERIQRRVDSL
ncbi:MAG: phosphopantetheine-binding protein [Planctomycetota bacterium]|jgi:acyl carrier protein